MFSLKEAHNLVMPVYAGLLNVVANHTKVELGTLILKLFKGHQIRESLFFRCWMMIRLAHLRSNPFRFVSRNGRPLHGMSFGL